MRRLAAVFAVAVSCLAGCAESSAGVANESAEVNASSDLAGTYKPASDSDGFYVQSVKVVREGSALILDLDGDRHPLARVPSGAYVFSSEQDGECDDPGCSYTSKISGVVYLAKVNGKKTPAVKLSFTREHPYPEYEGDVDTATIETERWSKAAAPETKGKPAPGTPTSDLAGSYAPATDDDGATFSKIEVVQGDGGALAIELDGERYALTKTKSGAYLFDSGEISGECDNPGCSYLSGVSGVVYLKKDAGKTYPAVKLTVREDHPHPEYDGDIEGETTSTQRWSKR